MPEYNTLGALLTFTSLEREDLQSQTLQQVRVSPSLPTSESFCTTEKIA